MGLSGLNSIRRRIKSVRSIEKITRAMALVATSKLRRARIKLEGNQSYRKHVEEIMKDIVVSMESDNLYTKERNEGKDLYFVATSNMGLSGAYNLNVFNEVMKNIRGNEESSIVMVAGEKGKVAFKRRGAKSENIFLSIGDDPTIEEADNISKSIIDRYTKDEIKNVFFVYTDFISSGRQAVRTEKIFPIQRNRDLVTNNYMEMELNYDQMFNELVNFYIREKILYVLISSKTSEQALRMTTMDAATKNARDILSDLGKEYNRIRQTSITEEISEIIGGTEAQR